MLHLLIFIVGALFGGALFLFVYRRIKYRGTLIFDLDDKAEQSVVLRFATGYEQIINQKKIVLKVLVKDSSALIDYKPKKEVN